LGEINSELFYQITTRIYSNFNLYKKKKRRYRYYRICLTCIFLFIFIVNLIYLFSTTKYYSDQFEIYSVYNSTILLSDDNIVLNIYNQSIYHIYIDIGCFNGETIEHFIHFNPNSSIYNIITFEPDPVNYYICKKRLTQTKYRNYNIIIIPKVVWIRNEKVSYQIDRGQRSRIDLNKNSSQQLDAIDFSLWLSHLIKTNNTKLHIKISTPGMEVIIFRKMINDGTLSLADKWDVEWTDRKNRRTRPARIYAESMFESLGYDRRYLTRLDDERKVFKINGTYHNVKKYYDWHKIAQIDTYSHYVQRPVVPTRSRKKKELE